MQRLAIVSLALFLASPAVAQGVQHADPSEIDRLVAGFTGQSIGAIGGAKAPVDRRLRLKACTRSLSLSWYGTPGRTVAIECAETGGWRIFVQTVGTVADHSSRPIVARGETVTISIRGRGFTVQRQGEAKEAGARGEWIKVSTGRDSAPVNARVERPGLVVIPAG